MTALRAPRGKFRVVGVDTFANEDWLSGDFETLEEAKKKADSFAGEMTKAYVYNDAGKCLHDAGTY